MELAVYTLMLMCSIYAVSGINFNEIIKRNCKWQAIFLQIILAMTLAYGSGTLLISIIDICHNIM